MCRPKCVVANLNKVNVHPVALCHWPVDIFNVQLGGLAQLHVLVACPVFRFT